MGNLLPLILAMTVAAEPLPVDRPVRPSAQVMAYIGTGLLAVGLMFEITGRAGADAKAPVLEWREHAQADTIGGIALMSAGLCFITIAALLTPWRLPPVGLGLTTGGVMVVITLPTARP